MVENVVKIEDKVTFKEDLHQGLNHYEGNIFYPQAIIHPVVKDCCVPVVTNADGIEESLRSSCTIKGTEKFEVLNRETHLNCHVVGNAEDNTSDSSVSNSEPRLISRIRHSKYPVVLIRKLGSDDPDVASQSLADGSTFPTEAASTSGMSQDGSAETEGETRPESELPVKVKALNSLPNDKGNDAQTITLDAPPSERPDTVTFRCFQCNFMTNHKASLKTHALIHSDTPTKFFKCSECNFETNWRYNFKNHSEMHAAASTGFKCSECDFESTWKDKFDYHLLIHSNPIMFKCSECDFESNWKRDFNKHMEIHGGTKRFKCAECEFETNWKNEFVYHLLVHTSTKIFKCAECGFKTSRKGNLTRHLLIHSTNIPKRFKCSTCEFNTHWNYKLTAHMLTHANDVPKLFKCDSCAFATHRKGNLTRHLLIHSNATKRLKCTECGYKTHWNYKLTAHMLKHTDRSYECPKCVYKASSRSDLKKHTAAQHKTNKTR